MVGEQPGGSGPDGGELGIGDIVGGRWRIDRYIASGGFGQVFAASDISAADIGSVAVKVLLTGASTAERQSFLAEVRHMAALRHRNLVAHIDSGLLDNSEQGAVFLVSELCDESLADFIQRLPNGRYPEDRLGPLVDDLSAGLAQLHRSSRVHRDLKPANILRRDSVWKLADFGLVRDLSASGVYHMNTVVGTPRYMAPEFFTGGTVGPATDIWSVGVVVHEIVTGTGVHHGDGPAFIHNLSNTAPTISPELTPATAELVRRCVTPNPLQRPAAADLPRILAGQAVPTPTVVASGPPSVGPAVTGIVPPPSTAPTELAHADAWGASPTVDDKVDNGRGRGFWLVAGAVVLLGLGLLGALAAVAFGGGDGGDTTAIGADGDAEATADAAAAAAAEAETEEAMEDAAAEGAEATDDAAAATDAAAGEDADDDAAATPGPVGERVALADWTVGECGDPDLADNRLVFGTRRACDSAHQYEVIALIEHPDTGGDFPGDQALFSYAAIECTRAFESKFGIADSDTSLQVIAFRPIEEEWVASSFSIVCVVNRGDTQPLTMALGDDISGYAWASGDSLNLFELQLMRCFDAPTGLNLEGLTQRLIYRECDEEHLGEHYWNVLLNDLEGDTPDSYPGAETISAEANDRCHDALHTDYGDNHREKGFTSTVVLPSQQEWEEFGAELAACVVVFEEPVAESLEVIAQQ